MVPLVEGFARACIQVPTLQKAFLMPMMKDPLKYKNRTRFCTVDWGVYYSAPGHYHDDPSGLKLSYPADSAWRRTLTYEVGKWRPSKELCSLLRSIGQDRHNKEPIERYIDRWATNGRAEVLEMLARSHGE